MGAIPHVMMVEKPFTAAASGVPPPVAIAPAPRLAWLDRNSDDHQSHQCKRHAHTAQSQVA
jgi:hypothetical protein